MNLRSLVLMLFLLPLFYVNGQKWKKLSDAFQNIPLEMRPAPLWFWNNSTIEIDELKRQMTDFKKAGYGGLSILPFGGDFKPAYLTEEYFKMYEVCMQEAEKLGLKLCIYDEYGFPSGTAGDINGDGFGRFKHKYSGYTNKRLDKTEYIPLSGKPFNIRISENGVMAVVAMDTVTFERIDLSGCVEKGDLSWNVPSGSWKIMVFNCVNAGNSIIDYLDPQAADYYIGMTHDEYYKRFSGYFGKVAVGTFFDEPTMYYADGRTWTPALNDKFKAVYGFDPALYYPALWYDIGEETAEARNYLFGFRAQLFSEGYIKKVSDWSVAHGIYATGHLDQEEILNATGTSGDLMKSFKHLAVPGIDKIGGHRMAEKFYKIISSSAYNWDKSLVMSETYGAMGNIGWEKLFGIAMDQYAKGINMLIPHAVWYNTERVTFLPELSLRNPIYADSLNVFNDYLARLNVLMQNNARWTGDIAILYPVATMQGDHYFGGPLSYYEGGVEIPYLDYTTLSTNLLDSLGYDHIYLHPEVLDTQCTVEKGKLKLHNKTQYNCFSTLFVPSSKTISLKNLEKIKEFALSGGTVIFTTQWPVQGTLAADSVAVRAQIEALSMMKNVYLIKDPSVPNLEEALSKCSERYDVKFLRNPVRNIHKVLDGKNLWFFANPLNERKQIEVVLNGKFRLEVWDPHTGIISKEPVDVKYKQGKTIVTLELPAVKSLFVVEK